MCEERVEVLRVRRKFKSNATFCVCFRVIDLYTIHDLSIPTGNRNFQLICESKSQYVDTRYLSSIGGSVFTEWNQMSCSGESKLEITDMTLTSFECLIDATCKYGNIVVTR
ncbi:unnamed protein product [Anisakis simplex]|uniref:Sushi domain-containing protein n=1 Tax=Anisakis simplex TaxID=6269 RepID=A0A0M3J9S3_ANISI|nr:unnamed protein product [Anisakis simplex]